MCIDDWRSDSWCRKIIRNLRWKTISSLAPPEHLQLFSRAGGRALLAAVGLRQVRVATEGVYPFELLNGLRDDARKPRRRQTRVKETNAWRRAIV